MQKKSTPVNIYLGANIEEKEINNEAVFGEWRIQELAHQWS